MNQRQRIHQELVEVILRMGYPEEFGIAIADSLGTEMTMNRMIRYLEHARPGSAEEIADEMLAILQVRESWVQQKISERANASITAFYNRPRDDEE